MVDQTFVVTIEVIAKDKNVGVADIRNHVECELRALSDIYLSDDWRKKLQYNVVKSGRILE